MLVLLLLLFVCCRSVSHVLSITDYPSSFHRHQLDEQQYKQLHYVMQDAVHCSIGDLFSEAVQFIRDALSNPSSRVLVHCEQGVSRSATIVLAYLCTMHHSTHSLPQLLQYVKQRRDIVSPNPAFMRQLRDYYAVLKEKERSDSSITQEFSKEMAVDMRV